MSFTFKQFHINDAHCAMKVGTDGVLLGAWANVQDAKKILDIGCGSGLVALMAAQRKPAAKLSPPPAVCRACARAALGGKMSSS